MAAILFSSPELESDTSRRGGVRAIAYQIVRYGLTASPTSRARYQLFRSDVNSENTFNAGSSNLHPEDGNYKNSAPMVLERLRILLTQFFKPILVTLQRVFPSPTM